MNLPSAAHLSTIVRDASVSSSVRKRAARSLGDSRDRDALGVAISLCGETELPANLQRELGRSAAQLATSRGVVKETFDLNVFDMTAIAYTEFASRVVVLSSLPEVSD